MPSSWHRLGVGDNELIDHRLVKTSSFGNPWHGYIYESVIYDSPGGVALTDYSRTFPAQFRNAETGATQLVQIPGWSVPEKTLDEIAFDSLQNFEWQPYAIVCDNAIYGEGIPDGWLIYIDGNSVAWLIDLVVGFAGDSFRVTASLVGRFGYFDSQNPVGPVNRQLADYTHTSFAPNPDAISTVPYDYGSGVNLDWYPLIFERSPDGSTALAHVYEVFPGAEVDSAPLLDFGLGGTRSYSLLAWLKGVFRIDITGNGSVSPGSFGDGISATVSLYKDTADCVTDNSVSKLDNTQDVLFYTSGPSYPSPISLPPWEDVSAGGQCDDIVHELNWSPDPHVIVPIERPVKSTRGILRIVFDASGSEVIYEAERFFEYTHESTSSITGLFSGEYTWPIGPPDEYGDCTDAGIDPHFSAGPAGTINEVHVSHTLYDVQLRVWRDNVLVDDISFQKELTVTLNSSQTHDGVFTQSESRSYTATLDGQPVDVSETENIDLVVHRYSPQVFGALARIYPETELLPGRSRMYRVVTPGGTSSAKLGDDVADMGVALRGCYRPVTHEVTYGIEGNCWYI